MVLLGQLDKYNRAGAVMLSVKSDFMYVIQ